jgi:hypothetical protein
MKKIKLVGIFFTLLFMVLLSIRLNLHDKLFSDSRKLKLSAENQLQEKDSWMNIFQNDRKIGYSHSIFSKTGKNYKVVEDLYMRINTMGVEQDLKLITEGVLNPDLSLSTFDFRISSGRFQFKAGGKVSEGSISVRTEASGATQTFKIPVKEKPFLSSGILQALANHHPAPGDSFTYSVFDPAQMSSQPIQIRVVKKEDIFIMGKNVSALKVAIVYQGATQHSWVGKNGDLLKEEGVLGFRIEKTTKKDALFGLPVKASQDLTQFASVPSNKKLAAPQELKFLKVRMDGIEINKLSLSGGRQKLENNILTIQKEFLEDFEADPKRFARMAEEEKTFLKPSPFITSDHPDIKSFVEQITVKSDPPFRKASKIIAWIEKNIEKRPVLSMPDALSVMKNKAGDCTEHAILTATLMRAAGIPSRIEAGLVYLNGRFYFHAWNRIFLGRWITVDSVFGQIPADVTHIRFAIGMRDLQENLMRVIDRVKLEVIESG